MTDLDILYVFKYGIYVLGISVSLIMVEISHLGFQRQIIGTFSIQQGDL
jgi:hypothetical protein